MHINSNRVLIRR